METEHEAGLRRKSDIGPLGTARPFQSIAGCQTPSTYEGDSDEDDNAIVTRMVSFAGSIDSDDIIGSPLCMFKRDSTLPCADMKDVEVPWGPCASTDSTQSSDSQIPWGPCSSADSSYSLGSLDQSSVRKVDERIGTRQLLSTMSPLQQLPNSCNRQDLHFMPFGSMEEENRTTLMVRNLPNNLSQIGFVQELCNRGYKGLFDFVYMPMNLRSDGNFGYAFVNFTSTTVAVQLMGQLQLLEIDDKEWGAVWGSCQGRIENVERYRNSPLMHDTVPADCKPALYDARGTRILFPAPTKKIAKPRIHQAKSKLVEKEHVSKGSAATEDAGMYRNARHAGRCKKNHQSRPTISKTSANLAAHVMDCWSNGASGPR